MAGGLHHAMPARAVRLLRLQRPGGGDRPAARPGRRAGRLRGRRRAPRRRRAGRSSTTTRGCSRSACTRRRWRSSPAPASRTRPAGRAREGSAVNVALPPGTDDAGWLRAFHAVVPSVLRAFRPQVLVTQCGADTHRLDPLADLRLTVDGQRAAYLALRGARRRAVRRPLGGHRRRRVRAGRGGAPGLDATCWPWPPASRSTRPRSTPPAWRELAAAPPPGPRRCRCG